jgi:hypothetical protein
MSTYQYEYMDDESEPATDFYRYDPKYVPLACHTIHIILMREVCAQSKPPHISAYPVF